MQEILKSHFGGITIFKAAVNDIKLFWADVRSLTFP